MLCAAGVDFIELNISCPNVKQGGLAFGIRAADASEVVSAVRKGLHRAADCQAQPSGREHPRNVQGRGGRWCRRHQPVQHLSGLRH